MIYKENLKKLRNEHNLTQEEMANILNIKRGVYSLYETEYVIMPIKHIIKTCAYFNISLDYLFGLTTQKNYKNSLTEIDSKTSGSRLKEFRKANNLTQEKLANILNVARTIISEYEKGNVLISTHALYTICTKYNISADYLLGKTTTITKEPQLIKN